MPLFAVEDMTAFTVAMAAITALGAFGTAYLNFKAGVAKLTFDGERVKMQADLTHLQEEHTDCERRHGELQNRHNELQGQQSQTAELVRLLRQRMEQHGIDCLDHGPDRRTGAGPDTGERRRSDDY